MLNRQKVPELIAVADLPHFKIEEQQLDNRLKTKFINAGSQELIKLQILFPAGMMYQEKSLQAFFTGKMLKEGSRNYSAAQLAETIDFYGAFLDVNVSRDHVIIHLISLNKYLDKIFPLILDLLKDPLFPEKELKVIKEQERQNFLHRIQKVKIQAQRVFNQEIFGKAHPYGTQAEVEDFDAINRDDLISFFKSHFLWSQAKIYVSGWVNSPILELLNLHFGQVSIETNASISTELQIQQLPPKEVFIEKQEALQSALRLGKICPDRKGEDFPSFALTQTILGGFFGSRLMQNIREDKGYTYGIYSNVQHLKHASIFNIASEVGSDVSLKALEEIHKEIKKLREEEVKKEELNLVKNYMSGNLLKSLNGPFALGEMVKTVDEFDLEPQYYQSFLKNIQNTTAEEVQKIAQKYFQEDSLTSIRVGK